MNMNEKPRSQSRPSYAEELPKGIRRGANRRLFVSFEGRFPDGTAFRRSREFEPSELRKAVNFLEKAKADFARGNGVGKPVAEGATVAAWCEHCVNVAMPAQRNGNRPKYSNEMLVGFREIVKHNIVPHIGKIPLDELDKSAVKEMAAKLPTDDVRAATLNVLTRVMELAEAKGKRRKGTNPCKGVSNRASQD